MSGRVYEYPPRTLRRSAIPDGIVIDGRISFQTAPKDSATTFKLDALPVELVQRIAGFCSIKTVLKLAKVNRALHRTCSDQYVFRSILLSGNGRPSPTKLEWYGSKLSLLEDPNTWAAYALADYKASKIESGKKRATRSRLWKMMEWLPHLMVLNHPVVEHIDIVELRDCLKLATKASQTTTPYTGLVYLEAMSFCYACRLLHGVQIRHPQSNHRFLVGPLFYRYKWPITRILKERLFDYDSMPYFPYFDRPSSIRIHAAANEAAGVLAVHIRNGLRTDVRVYVHSLDHQNCRPPPSLRTTPLHKNLDRTRLARPFDIGAPLGFVDHHLQTMTDPAFLRDGEWMCYLWDRVCVLPARPHRRPPVERIRWSAFEVDSDRGAVQISAPNARFNNQSPNRSKWRFMGEVYRKTGQVRLRVQSPELHWLGLDGLMTPFGMVGNWTQVNHPTKAAWFWICKTAWSDGAKQLVKPGSGK